MVFSQQDFLRFEEIIRQHKRNDDSFSDESLPDPEEFEIEVLTFYKAFPGILFYLSIRRIYLICGHHALVEDEQYLSLLSQFRFVD